ncbi:DAN domain family member 5-like [Leptodactylus fuscus]|uniref:DAN domain family member 5-like n=1 Tax=Leptodactylus fuscus TaxID=238119 RepID=UPI003F4E529D
MLLLLLIVAASLVSSTPFLEEEEGSAFIKLDTHNGEPQVISQSGPPLPFHNNPSIGRGESDSFKPGFQEMPRDLHLNKEAFQRRLIWENAIQKKPRVHPDQILPLHKDALTRVRCDALPFIQKIFRKNCAPLRVPNKFCFGQCNSFYIPGWPSDHPQPCMSCLPSRSRRITIPLQCRGPRVWWEDVVIVEECDCDTILDREFSQTGSAAGFLPS